MLHMAVLRSPHAHARIVSIDTSRGRGDAGRRGRHHAVPTCRVSTASACSCTTSRSWRAARCATSASRWRRWHPKTRWWRGARWPKSRWSTSRCRRCSTPTRRMRPGAPVLHDYAPDNIVKHIPIRVGDIEQGFRRIRPDRGGDLHHPAGRARLSRAGGRPRLRRCRRRGHHPLAEPEHHAPPPHAVAHHRAADQQGALHHEPGRRRLRRQGGHGLPGHAGADGDEDAAAGAPGVHARGIHHHHRQAASLAHDIQDGPHARRPHPRGRDQTGVATAAPTACRPRASCARRRSWPPGPTPSRT